MGEWTAVQQVFALIGVVVAILVALFGMTATIWKAVNKKWEDAWKARVKEAKTEKKVEASEQLKLCTDHAGSIDKLFKKYERSKETDKVLVKATILTLDSLERISHGQQTNGEIKPMKRELDEHLVNNLK